MKNKDIDVLGLEWTSFPSRDRISATLVCNYLRLQGLNVVESSVWDGLQTIHDLRPKLLFITNTVGAWENFELMRYAKRRGLLGLSLVSEGNFQGDAAYQQAMIWGWNKEGVLYEDRNLQWSIRTRDMTCTLHPELEGRIKISGGVGFDNYKISPKSNTRIEFLSKYKKNKYKKVVGVGCWDFGLFLESISGRGFFQEYYEAAQQERFARDALGFDRVLAELISENKDILFLLKEHPANTRGLRASGIETSSRYENVLVLKNEEPISQCIEMSDIWIVYESTTALEAWLLGKPTCLLNPSGRDFPRDKLNEGSPAFRTVEELQTMIDLHYSGAVIPDFAEREGVRKSLIKNVIQWDDGLNHVRAGNEIIDLLCNQSKQAWVRESPREMIGRWKQHAKWKFWPYLRRSAKFKTSAANRLNFLESDLRCYEEEKRQQQENFYRRCGLSLADLKGIRCL